MSGWLLDTNVLSELRKPNCNANVRAWSKRQFAGSLYFCEVGLAEIRFGIDNTMDPAKKQDLEQWLEFVVRPWFAGRILVLDEDAILRWRELMEIGRRRGHTFSQPDLLFAALADLHGLGLATRNIADFRETGVPLVNPWEFTP